MCHTRRGEDLDSAWIMVITDTITQDSHLLQLKSLFFLLLHEIIHRGYSLEVLK